MADKPRPKPCILDDLEVFGVRGGKKIWRSTDGDRYFTWDGLHGEVEIFDKRGWHLGACDPVSGEMLKEAVKGRKIDV